MTRFSYILNDSADTVERKNHDYGSSFANIRDKYGPIAFHVRIADKLARITQLNKSEAKVDESILDTLQDIIGYCTLEIAYCTGEGFRNILGWELVEDACKAYDTYKDKRVAYGTEVYKSWLDSSWGMYENFNNPEYLYTMIKDTAMEIVYREEVNERG